MPSRLFKCALGLLCAGWIAISLGTTSGCESGFKRIDKQVEALVTQTSAELGSDALPPSSTYLFGKPDHGRQETKAASEHPHTVNPSASELPFTALQEANDVIDRLNSYAQSDGDAIKLDLPLALVYAAGDSREYQFAEEEYVLAALRLLIERHRWGPRFFDEVSALAFGDADQGLYDTSLRLVNEFRITQQLPFGGEVSARALASATEDLHERVAGEEVQDAALILEADIPLLRGSGLAARENRIQAERDLIYAARDFEQFRRDYLFEISQDFLDLVVQQQTVANAERQVQRLQQVEQRERTLYEAGRTPRFQAALAEQAAVTALDTLNTRRENFRLATDRFKLRLGIPVHQPVIIVPSGINLPIPATDMDQAVRLAMTYRLDLQTQRDVVDDARRGIQIARNSLLPDLNLTGSLTVPTDRARQRAGLRFAPDDASFSAGMTLGLPLDRKIERLTVRQAQIEFERQQRQTDLLRDEIAVNVRAAVRDIDRARYTLQIQERSVAIGQQRIASINAAPDRATARDASDAANELARAQDRRDAARRDLQVAVIRYLLETGQLRVDASGFIRPLQGMVIDGDTPSAGPETTQPDPPEPQADVPF